jgi:5-formyltetrahydrofolate cyclo-ligase
MTEDAAAGKVQLRVTVLAARQRLTSAARAAAGAAITDHGLAQWQGVGTIAAYYSVGIEPPTEALIEALLAGGSRVLLPVIDGAALDWAAYTGPNELTRGPFGLSEPSGPRLGEDALAQADVVVMPALAVDRLGNRLGHGRGFYDRALIDVAAPIVAVVYDAELIDDVPAEAHDHRVDAVLRPAGLTDLPA